MSVHSSHEVKRKHTKWEGAFLVVAEHDLLSIPQGMNQAGDPSSVDASCISSELACIDKLQTASTEISDKQQQNKQNNNICCVEL